jgi:LmbE family N-acetylglucosaminyl deacetylase
MKTIRPAPRAMAVAAHPDDIEFLMAGTLLLLGRKGWELHYMTLSSGNCGSMVMGPAKTRAARKQEARAAAKILGATWHPSLADDLEIVYEVRLLRALAAVIREVAPQILLVPSPQDYMEDHMNTARLAVTAAFARGMPNFRTIPARNPVSGDITLYHAMPHGLRDGLRRRIVPELFVNTAAVHEQKRAALAAHASQKDWLDKTQGMGSYLQVMDDMSAEVGRMSGRFEHAEGWRRHLHLGFSASETDPLRDALGPLCCLNPRCDSSGP